MLCYNRTPYYSQLNSIKFLNPHLSDSLQWHISDFLYQNHEKLCESSEDTTDVGDIRSLDIISGPIVSLRQQSSAEIDVSFDSLWINLFQVHFAYMSVYQYMFDMRPISNLFESMIYAKSQR